jgi:putative membrane protein
MRYLLAALLAISTLGLSIATANAAEATSAADRAFIAKVSQGGMFEVALGHIAALHGSTQDIRDQGTTEVHDHTLVGDKLKAIAQASGITISAALNAQFQTELDDLKAKSGLGFDAAYLHAMELIHTKDGAAFAMEAKSGSNPPLRAFAAETHRIVLRHIGELRAIGP